MSTLTTADINGMKVFSATLMRDRQMLGEKVTEWLREQTGLTLIDYVVTQSSDAEFHCLAITVLFHKKTADEIAVPAPKRLKFTP